MLRVDDDLVDRYRKSSGHEQFLRAFNGRLEGLALELLESPPSPTLPPVFIVGPPRSGTTLVSQMLVMRGGYGHVSNFVARFYKAPAVGMMLQDVLGQDLRNPPHGRGEQCLESEFGRTQGLLQPHEFGYFWDRWFDQGQRSHKLSAAELAKVPAAELTRELASMEFVAGTPMVYKHPPYCSLQIPWLLEHLPNAVFISCTRDELYNAQSIAMVRKKLLGGMDKWFSTRPSQIEHLLTLPWHEQIAQQLHIIGSEVERARRVVPLGQWVDCSYEELCRAPGEVLARIDQAVVRLGAKLPASRDVPATLPNRNNQALANAEFSRLRDACTSTDATRATR